MKAPVPKYNGSWSPSHKSSSENDPTREQKQSTSDLLRWISDVTIKRRQIRKASRCSNLFAEAILSNALRKARRDLASKQEEKRKNLQLFSSRLLQTNDNYNNNALKFNCSVRDDNAFDQDFQLEKNPVIDSSNMYKLTVTSISWQDTTAADDSKDSIDSNSRNNDNDFEIDDEEINACLASLDSFFNELKSVKV